MNCDGVRGLLSAYLDGELSPGELLRVEQHLRRCPVCADEVDSLRQTIALVASLDEVEVPATFHMQLHERLVALGPPMAQEHRKVASSAWQRGVRRWAVPAAAAAAALAISLTSFPQAGNLVKTGLEGPAGNFQVPGGVPASGDVAETGSGFTPDSGETGGNSGPTDPDPGETVRDPSGGEMVAEAGNQGSVDSTPENPAGGTGGAGGSPNATGGTSGDAQAVGVQPGTGVTNTDLAPQYTYSIAMTAPEAARQDLVSALAVYQPMEASDSILVTVPAGEREAAVAAILAVPGVKLAAEPAETKMNLAQPIHDTTTRLAADREQLKALEEQMASLDDAALADARSLQKALEERIAQSAEALDRLSGQVDKAFITVRLEAQGQ